jgi:sRNA-binding protein
MFQHLMRPAYGRAVLQGGPRYDLNGQPRGEVTLKEQEHARRDLAAFEEQKRNPAPRVSAPRENTPA